MHLQSHVPIGTRKFWKCWDCFSWKSKWVSFTFWSQNILIRLRRTDRSTMLHGRAAPPLVQFLFNNTKALFHCVRYQICPQKGLFATRCRVLQRNKRQACIIMAIIDARFIDANNRLSCFIYTCLGSNDYTAQCRTTKMTINSLLRQHPSCRCGILVSVIIHLYSPPLEVLLEHLPPLQPRYYSACSYEYGVVKFSFNVSGGSNLYVMAFCTRTEMR